MCFVFCFFFFTGQVLFFVFFFFSSRRRHTRCYRDWSSDVCSSDLGLAGGLAFVAYEYHDANRQLQDLTLQLEGTLSPNGTDRQRLDGKSGRSGDLIASSGEVALERKGYIIPAH